MIQLEPGVGKKENAGKKIIADSGVDHSTWKLFSWTITISSRLNNAEKCNQTGFSSSSLLYCALCILFAFNIQLWCSSSEMDELAGNKLQDNEAFHREVFVFPLHRRDVRESH